MKSKRRHELQTNVLADWTGKQLKAIQPYTNWIIGGVIAILAVAVLLSIRASRQETASEEGWARFEAASAKGFDGITSDEPLDLKNAISELESVAREYEGTTLFTYTQLTLGDMHLRSGQTKYRANQTAARDHFKSASQHYQEAVAKSKHAGLKNRATYSLAKSYEWQMKLEQAKETYAKVEGAYAMEAQMRMRDLDRPSTHSFYDQYAQWKPKEQPGTGDQRYPAPGFDLDPEDSPADGEIDYGSFLDDTVEGTDTDDAADLTPGVDATDGPAEGGDAGGAASGGAGTDAAEATETDEADSGSGTAESSGSGSGGAEPDSGDADASPDAADATDE